MPRKPKNTTGIPDFEIESIARALLPLIQQFYNKEEGRKEFEEWQTENRKRKNKAS